MASRFYRIMYTLRGVTLIVPILLAIVCRPDERSDGALAWSIAIALFLFGFGIRVWAQQHLHFRLAIGMKLTTTGPYSIVRNPIYIGNTLIGLSLIVASQVWWLLPVMLATCTLTFPFVVRYEENLLEGLYGEEYLRYKAAVPRWTPKLGEKPTGLWLKEYIRKSILVEAYNALFLVPFIIKDILR